MEPAVQLVVREADEHRARFEAFCRSLSPTQLEALVPGSHWRAKDYVAHLATIDIWVNDWFEHMAECQPWHPKGEGGAPFNIDDWNEARIRERYDAAVEDLLREAAGHRARLWGTVDRFTPDVLEERFVFRGKEITFLRYLQLWIGHDPAHSVEMVAAAPEALDDQEVRRWLGPYLPKA